MASIDLRTKDGGTNGTIELDDAIFGITPNVSVMHQVVTAQLAAARRGTQSTLTRAEVRGGGAKPWRQKGTGRARAGSLRAPNFSGGGVALGPKPRSYKQKTPKKMVQLALRSALSDRASEGRVAVVEAWDWAEPKTKVADAALRTLGIEGKVLLVVGTDDELAFKAFRNLTHVHIQVRGELNAYDTLCSDWVVFTKEALPGGPNTDAPVHEPAVAAGEVPDTSAPLAAAEGSASDEAEPTGKERSDAEGGN